MITAQDKQTIQKLSEKYAVKRVVLFGSSLDATKESRDIDIAVEGIAERDFFRYYGELMFSLSKPVDIIDLSRASKFVDLVRNEGILLYGGL